METKPYATWPKGKKQSFQEKNCKKILMQFRFVKYATIFFCCIHRPLAAQRKNSWCIGKRFVFCLASRWLGSAAHKARRRSKGIGDVVKRGEPGKAQLAEPIASLLIILIIAAKYLETLFFAAKNVQGYAADYVYAEQRRGYTASKNQRKTRQRRRSPADSQRVPRIKKTGILHQSKNDRFSKIAGTFGAPIL